MRLNRVRTVQDPLSVSDEHPLDYISDSFIACLDDCERSIWHLQITARLSVGDENNLSV